MTELKETSTHNTINNQKPKAKLERIDKATAKAMRDKDRENVRGKFIFHECPGGVLEFVYRAYKEDPIEKFTLVDGMVYDLPLGVAKHLNKNCWYPEYGFVKGESNTAQASDFSQGKMMKITNKVRRVSFQSLEFVDIEDLTPEVGIAKVEMVF